MEITRPFSSSNLLPDIQSSRADLETQMSLEWVGMSQIECPILYSTGTSAGPLTFPARVSAGVNLIDANARGIHMSRLYRLVVAELPQSELRFELLESLVRRFLESQEGLSSEAELTVKFEALLSRPSLKSGLSGFRSYPVEMRVTQKHGVQRRFLKTQVMYSSTCPQSAALARQLVAGDFLSEFQQPQVSRDQVKTWLESPAGMAATPHAQRSTADLQIEMAAGAGLTVEGLLNLVEGVLATPVQTLVKREDEQEFARRNGTHLMFCEDAARKLKTALWHQPGVVHFEAELRHLESLHPHDAVARIQGPGSFNS